MRAGIDEAGRGPVLGPLVMSVVLLSKESEAILKAEGVRDSKLVAKEKRPLLAARIRELAEHVGLVVAEPARIDEALASPVSNLNRLEAGLTAELLEGLCGHGPCVVAIDLPSRNAAAYEADILRFVPRERLRSAGIDLLLEHKADVNHVAAAAASIIAKVERDAAVEAIEQEAGVPVGSGYMTDPRTRAFLDEHGRTHERFFRTKWSSYADRFPSVEQRSLHERF